MREVKDPIERKQAILVLIDEMRDTEESRRKEMKAKGSGVVGGRIMTCHYQSRSLIG